MKKQWKCVEQCGACCYLEPSERPFLGDYLNESQMAEYMALVGPDGWCINFDQATRRCGIYATRPAFCRVSTEVVESLYGEDPADLERWAAHCCRDHIDSVYGETSVEMKRFNREVRI